MKKSISFASLVTLTASVGVASAATFSGSLKGSDTLADVTQDILDQCVVPGLSYIGGGSGGGENAMRNGEQVVAPMSRPFGNAAVCQNATFGSNQSVVVGLDGIAL